MASEEKKPKKLTPQRFLQLVSERYFEADVKYCFILGAGASRTSGIRPANELMKEWLQYLKDKGESHVQESARSIGLPEDKYAHLFKDNYKPDSNDYFTLFELRFADMQDVAYRYLEREMTNDTNPEKTNVSTELSGKPKLKFPSYGYLCLACLLCDSDNRFVVTTNFDPMVEEALSVCRGVRPLVIGHETLARFIESNPHRPVIAKVHRDLLYQPMNTSQEMSALREEWKTPLSSVLTNYVPIVLGYAGADHTLMDLLENLPLKGLYWCGMESTPPERIAKLLAKQNGYWIQIDGFDEIMFRLLEKFLENPDFKANYTPPITYINAHSTTQLTRYEEQRQKLITSMEQEATAREKAEDAFSSSADDQEELSAKAASLDALAAQNPDGTPTEYLHTIAVASLVRGHLNEALYILDQAIKLAPEDPRYYDSRSTTLHKMGCYSKALDDSNTAIQLAPENPEYYLSRGATLHKMKRYYDALADKSKAIELDPENPRYFDSRSITLHKMKRFPESLKDSNTAIQLAPTNPRFYSNRSATLHAMKRYSEALDDSNTAIQFAPQNPVYYCSRGITLHALGHYSEALEDFNESIKLAPYNPAYYRSRSITLYAMGRLDEAKADQETARKLHKK